ncbi:MAG: hypothetical protein JJT96_00545 [Opitutales bacterium]|nr:hypothetical protein [Opitutales bacterium]
MILKRLIFLYFILLILEGALRKWFLPGLATPLLLVRDPVVLAIYFIAFQQRLFPLNNWVMAALGMAGLASLTTLVVGHGHIPTIAFGVRANFLHVPLIFVMARALDVSDVWRYATWMLYIALPMTVLLAVQFLSPPTAWVNVGIGGEGTASFDGVGDRMRSSGTFSFINGLVAFYTLAFSCWLAHLLNSDRRTAVPGWLLAACGAALILSIPLSISRHLMVGAGIVAAGAAAVFLRSPGGGKLLARVVLVVGIALVVASQLPIFDEALGVMEQRVEQAAEIEGTADEVFVHRIWNDLAGPLRAIDFGEPFGIGLGAGTQAGAQLFMGQRGFHGGEGEWWRLLWEMGFLLGGFFILYRFWLTVRMALFGWYWLKGGNPLPWLIFLAAGPLVLNGQWGQSTALGFAVFGAGLCLAAGRLAPTAQD